MAALWRGFLRTFALAVVASYLFAPVALVFAAAPKPICQIIVTPSSISVGGSVTVKWASTNATAGAITNIGNVSPAGSINLLPSSAALTTYFGAFTGPGGTANCQASVAVSTSAGTAPAPTQSNPVDVGTAISINNTTPASSGLVPCGYAGYDASGNNARSSSTGCQACDLAQLVQNLINFAIGIAIPIAAALFAWAGILYFTSGANPGNRDKAKKIFQDALIGFAIAITAWLVVNTVLHVIFTGSTTFGGGNWFSIQCENGANRPTNGKIGTLLSQIPALSGGAVQGNGNIYTSGTPGTSGSVNGGGDGTTGIGTDSYNTTLGQLSAICDANNDKASCDAANNFADTGKVTQSVQDVLIDSCSNDSESTSCTILSQMSAPAKGGANTLCNNSNCSPDALTNAGFTGSSAKVMSCIAMTENSGNATKCNGNACGTFQIMLTVNKLSGPDCGGTLNCPALCKGNNGVAVTTASCQPCVVAANNAQCNAESAAALYNQSGYAPWTTQSDNTKSDSCVNTYGSQ